MVFYKRVDNETRLHHRIKILCYKEFIEVWRLRRYYYLIYRDWDTNAWILKRVCYRHI